MINKQQIKFIRSLQQKKYRDEYKMFIVEGLKSVNEAIETSPQLVKAVYVACDKKEMINIKPIPNHCSCSEVVKEEFQKLSSLKAPQGILALINQPVIKFPEYNTLKDLILVLDRISDPGNLGTIIRLADWFGIEHIICSNDTVDCYNPKVVQASMGCILRVKIHYTDLPVFIKGLKTTTDLTVYSTSLIGENIYQTRLSQPAIIIFGNESNGVSDELTKLTDTNLLIPNNARGAETAESLNVSIASAIVCAEFRRQVGTSYSK
jgi:RNA methyltransferase, TrmH family